MSNEKSCRAVYDSIIERRLLRVHTSFPAVITALSGTNTVDVQPLIRTKMLDGSQEDYPVIPDVRMQVMSVQRGDIAITMPYKVGDNVWVFVSERDMSNIMDGDGSSAANAQTLTLHDLSDCFCIPAFHTDGNPLDIDPDNIVIKNKSTTIIVKEDEVVLTTTKYEVNADEIQFTCSSFNVDSDSFTHNSVNVGDDHKHTDGTYIAGSTKVTEKSGEPEQ